MEPGDAHLNDVAALGPLERRLLPAHGPIACRKCWPTDHPGTEFTTSDHRIRIVNDPGAWGSQSPSILVLGISKGFTQAREFASGEFDSVPFKNCRARLRDVLAAVGLMNRDADIDSRMTSLETDYAWGSVVRCSLSGRKTSEDKFSAGTPDVLPAFDHYEAAPFLRGCMREHLMNLPARTRTIVLLGNDDRYIETIARELQRMYGDQYSRLNAVAHKTDDRAWVHVAHPSPGNGHFRAFVDGATDTKQGLKRKLAQDALSVSHTIFADPRSLVSTTHRPVALTQEFGDPNKFDIPSGTLVPVAADGTWFGPHLRRATGFTVGAKGDEQQFQGFSDALEFLRKAPTARWRRPNRDGNWGIVTARHWKRADELDTDVSRMRDREAGLK
jgi:hypothetical protein